MDVLKLELPLKLAGLNFFADLSHAALDVFEVLGGNHADLFEHGCVSNGTININERHALVEVNARGVAKNKSVNRFREAAGPGLLLGMQGICYLPHCSHIMRTLRGVAQPGSAPALGAGCREFESRRPDQKKVSARSSVG